MRELSSSELKSILELHSEWLEGKPDGKRANLRGADLQRVSLQRADLRWADLREADLHGADLHGANLRGADLRGANLQGVDLQRANLDYSCWPLHCSSLDAIVCKKIAAQILYHFCRLVCEDPDTKEVQSLPQVKALANQFHRIDECGKLE